MKGVSSRASGPWLLFACALGLTVVAVIVTLRASSERDRARFAYEAATARAHLAERMEVYVAMLRGGAGLMDASETVTRAEFHEYIERLYLSEFYPGVQGMGWTMRLRPEDVPEVLAAMRAEGHPSFTLHPPPREGERHAILFLEPMDERNAVALGYDMYSEPVRRAAMERARDEGAPALSGKVTLLQEIDQERQAGFLLYVPVYRGSGIPPTVAERRERLHGFVYGAFRADDLVRGVFRRHPPPVAFVVYDGTEVDPAAILTRLGTASPDALHSTSRIETAGRTWTLVFASLETPGHGAAIGLGLGGGIASVALLLLSRAEVRARAEAERRGEEVRELNATLEQRVAERTAALQEANRELEAFSYMVSHDLRAPLRHILGFAQLLEESEPGLGPEQQGYLRRIGAAARRGGELVDDLLLFSRVGRTEPECQPIDTTALVEELRRELERNAPDRRIEWRIGPLPTVHGDPSLVRQVLANLLGNALKFTRVREVAVIEVRGEERPDEVEIRVCDNGVGFDAAYAEKLFGVFERLHTGFEGTGIGTAIVRRIVTRHGGRVWAQGEVDRGATFFFTLPRRGA